MGARRWTAGWFRSLGSSGDGDGKDAGNRMSRRRRFRSALTTAWRWRRPNFRLTVLDDVAYFLLSIVEAIVLVAVFFFYICRFGCHI